MHICSEGISLGSGPPKSCQKLLDLKGLWGSFQNIPKCQTQPMYGRPSWPPGCVVQTHIQSPTAQGFASLWSCSCGLLSPSLGSLELKQRGHQSKEGQDAQPAGPFSGRVGGMPGGVHRSV